MEFKDCKHCGSKIRWLDKLKAWSHYDTGIYCPDFKHKAEPADA